MSLVDFWLASWRREVKQGAEIGCTKGVNSDLCILRGDSCREQVLGKIGRVRKSASIECGHNVFFRQSEILVFS